MNQSQPLQSQIFNMGTVITTLVYGENADEVLSEVEREIDRLNRLLSRFVPESEISRINTQAGITPVAVSEETFQLIQNTIKFSKLSDGLWDITVGPLISLWEAHKREKTIPDTRTIIECQSLVDYRNILLDDVLKVVYLKEKGQSVDLGGIGKGYAADRISQLLRSHRIESAYTNFGGNVSTVGTKPDGSPWNIGIQHPRQPDKLIGLVPVKDKTVVTSGDYQRFFLANDGKRYHHIINPKTGYPSESGLISTTIIADNSETADALSTMTFLAGLEESREIIKAFEEIEAVFIDKTLNVYLTRGIADRFEGIGGLKINVI